VNRQTVRVLQEVGCDVHVPRTQVCCGAIHHHGGRVDEAVAFAKANIDAFFPENDPASHPDFLVNNIAGCGAMLKDYAHLLRDNPLYAERAKLLVSRTRDISELLVELDPPKPRHELNRTVTYHDACHLAHAQKLPGPPRKVLSWIKGLRVVPLAEADMCCGAAGTYNLAHPVMARQLAERKVRHVERTKARICVTANAGCAMQIQSEAERMGVDLHVTHPITLLYEAYFGDDAP
jgi:glycolate oxidase iron-sulfur subunit